MNLQITCTCGSNAHASHPVFWLSYLLTVMLNMFTPLFDRTSHAVAVNVIKIKISQYTFCKTFTSAGQYFNILEIS